MSLGRTSGPAVCPRQPGYVNQSRISRCTRRRLIRLSRPYEHRFACGSSRSFRARTKPASETPNGNLRHGVLARLIAGAADGGCKLTEQEIQRRLKCARAYVTEAQIREAAHGFGNWDELARAGFPAAAVPAGGEPCDPRDTDEKWRDFGSDVKRSQGENPEQLMLSFDLPGHFSHGRYGPGSPVSALIAACGESERYTANMTRKDKERRAYVTELLDAAGGDTSMSWYEAEGRRLGLAGLAAADPRRAHAATAPR